MGTTTGLGIAGVGQIAVNAHDLPRAVGFYRDVLGLPYLFEIPDAAFFQCGGVRLMVGKAEKPEFDHPGSILYYRVPDIHAAAGSLRAAGVRIRDEPHLIAKMPGYDLWMMFFYDTEQNLAALMSEVASS
ncbi:MAG TPA: VOC family protein [Longimicrobiaceae bacterium]|nr:VOC family protein [Longimicrobiaceae bacterium]